MELNEVVERIKKLMAKAKDDATSEAEADACARKARTLMDEYGVSEGSLAERNAGAGMVDGKVKYFEPWRRNLFTQVARYYGCRMIHMGDNDYRLVGRETSRMVAQGMFEYLESTSVRLAQQWRKGTGGTRGEQLNFERACGARIAQRLLEARKAIEAGAEIVAGSGTEVVLMTEARESDLWLQNNMPNVQKTTNKVKQVGDGAVAGREAGGKVSFASQVGGGAGRGPLLVGRG